MGPPEFPETIPVADGGESGGAHDLAAWVARLAVDEAARSRSRGAWLQRQAEQEGTFAGVLADLAERGRPVVVHLHNTRVHHGVLAALGADFVVLATANGRDVILRREAIASVRTRPGEPVTIGDRLVITDATLGEALAVLGEDRPWVLVIGSDATGLRGELRAVGADVVTIRQDGGATAYVALASVAEVSLTDSG